MKKKRFAGTFHTEKREKFTVEIVFLQKIKKRRLICIVPGNSFFFKKRKRRKRNGSIESIVSFPHSFFF